MRALRIFGLGLLGTGVVVSLTVLHLWRVSVVKAERLRALRELTPERLIANCGKPLSDSESFWLSKSDARPSKNDATSFRLNVQNPPDKNAVPLIREIEYPSRVKLEFLRKLDNQGQPIGWSLIHFSSPEVGRDPSEDDAYIAVPYLPCMVRSTQPPS